MAARASRNYIKNLLYQNSKIGASGGGGGGLGAVRHSSFVPKIHPKIPRLSKKGRIFTTAFLGIVISGGAYVSTLDEATACGWLLSATKLVNPFFAYLNADPSILGMEVWGLRISNPIGLDKNTEADESLLGMGILRVKLGKNKTSEDVVDYVQGVHTLSQYVDYLVIDVSSPNAPGSRKLQGREQLKDLVEKVQAARDGMKWGEEGPLPLLVKIDADLSKLDLEDIVVTLRVDGLYPFILSLNVLRYMYHLTRLIISLQGKIPLIGCEVISYGEDAGKKVQLSAAFSCKELALIPQKKVESAERLELETDECKSTTEATGAEYR
ncbi:hypothetical protein MKW92_041104 [Papaver armeniacum]|nr:hypothetical protein MKW92_041104 [Papaver armeniacum]